MCLAVPGRILAITEKSAAVDFGGVERVVRTDLLPDVTVGQYVLVHAGFAIQHLDLAETEETLALLEEVFAAGNGSDSGEQDR